MKLSWIGDLWCYMYMSFLYVENLHIQGIMPVFTSQPTFGQRGIVVTSAVCPIHVSIQILSGPVLRKLYMFHIFRAEQSYLEPVHCQIILTVWLSALKIWPSPWNVCLEHCMEIINDNCIMCSGHINLNGTFALALESHFDHLIIVLDYDLWI